MDGTSEQIGDSLDDVNVREPTAIMDRT